MINFHLTQKIIVNNAKQWEKDGDEKGSWYQATFWFIASDKKGMKETIATAWNKKEKKVSCVALVVRHWNFYFCGQLKMNDDGMRTGEICVHDTHGYNWNS
jgi:hypothetical protein